MGIRTVIVSVLALASACVLRASAPDIMDVAGLVSDGDYATALDSLSLMMQRDSLDDAVWYYKGVCESETGNMSGAAASYMRAIQLDSTNRDYRSPYILTIIGDDQLYNYQNDSLALKFYDEAVRKDPTYAPALLGRAETYRMRGNLAPYFADIDPFLRMEYINPEMKCNYVSQVIERTDNNTYRFWHKQLDGMMDALAQTHPSDSCTLCLAGSWFYNTGQKEKGRNYFEQWIASEPENVNAQLLHISLVLNNDSVGKAITACDEALAHVRSDKEKAEILDTKASLLHEAGQTKKTLAVLEEALKLDPDNISLLNNYAYFLSLEKKNLKKAEEMSRRTIDAEPDNATFLDTYGWILHLRKKDAEAKVYFKKAIIHGGKDHSEILMHYSVVLDALGEKELAKYYRNLYEKSSK